MTLEYGDFFSGFTRRSSNLIKELFSLIWELICAFIYLCLPLFFKVLRKKSMYIFINIILVTLNIFGSFFNQNKTHTNKSCIGFNLWNNRNVNRYIQLLFQLSIVKWPQNLRPKTMIHYFSHFCRLTGLSCWFSLWRSHRYLLSWRWTIQYGLLFSRASFHMSVNHSVV